MRLVSQYYSQLSESLMYEWSLETPTRFNGTKRTHYEFFISIKSKEREKLTFEEVTRLDKIVRLTTTAFKRPTFKRR